MTSQSVVEFQIIATYRYYLSITDRLLDVGVSVYDTVRSDVNSRVNRGAGAQKTTFADASVAVDDAVRGKHAA
jgi:hypothetical protein